MKWTALLVLLVACTKKPSLDCDAYAAKFTRTIDAAPERYDSVFAATKRECETGHVSDKLAGCVMSANTPDDIYVCQGLQPLHPENHVELPAH